MKTTKTISAALAVAFAFAAVAAGCQQPRARPGSGSVPAKTRKAARPAKLQIDRPDPRERLLGPVVARLLKHGHLRDLALDDAMSTKAFDHYVKGLDYGKLFLLAEDVAKLRVYRNKIDDQLKSGSFALAHLGSALLKRRYKALAKYVAKQLSKPFDYTKDEVLQSDHKKRKWARDEATLFERWRKMLKLEVLQRAERMADRIIALKKALKNDGKGTGQGSAAGSGSGSADSKKVRASLKRSLAKIPTTVKGRLTKARADLAKRYAGRFARLVKPDPLDGATTFVNAITNVFDPHTGYLPPATKENFDIHMSGSLEGIGAVLTEDDHYIRVVRVVPGGASWRQGELEVGDLILSVAQEGKEPVSVVDMRIDRVVRMIRGPKGTVVRLTVKKPDERIKVVSIVRDVIKIETAYAQGAIVRPQSGEKIGYIYLPSFYGNTRARRGLTPPRRCGNDIRKLLTIFARRKVAGVIVDLRGNGGGLLDDARSITGLFIKTGPIVQTKSRSGRVQVLRDDDPDVVFKGHVIVLVDRYSASASEIVAGALKDYGRAVIVGTGATHGKGTVQVLLGLDRALGRPGRTLGVLKLTRHQFFRINGASTQLRGVVPDVKLVSPSAYRKSGERRLDNALPWSSIAPAQFRAWPKPAYTPQTLASASAARQAKSDIFAKYRKRNALLKARREASQVPLSRKRWVAWIEKRKKELEALTPDKKKGPARLKVDVVQYAKTTTVRPRPGSKKKRVTRADRFKKRLARDPWLAETVNVLLDMRAAK